MIIVENANVDYPLGSNGTTQIRIDHDNYIPRYFKLCEDVHRQGACIAIQINHAGASAQSARTQMQPVSASAVPSKASGEMPRSLTPEEIGEIVKKYAQAAARAKAAGFDAVEIHAGHSYLLSQFLSPTTNFREDAYGGSPENRARFTTEVCQAVRLAVGPGFPIFIRLSAEELVEGGNTLEDTLGYIAYFDAYVDAYDVSCGLNGSIQYQIDANHLADGWRSYMARAVKERYRKPCITMGNIRSPQVAEDILARGDADIIGMGRGLIADPRWVEKVATGQEDLIRKCISCNIGCAGNRIGINRPIRCTVNPCVNETEDYKDRPIVKPCNVVVIGGGTAGMEAACTAAEVGCTTFLLEKEKTLGGLSSIISTIPAKKRLGDFPTYLQNRCAQLPNLFILKGEAVTMEGIERFNPNIIVNATGSNPLLPTIDGLYHHVDRPGSRVASITGMIAHLEEYPEDMRGKKVVVVGGGAVGLDVVELMAPRGAQVSIVEMLPEIGADLDPVTRSDINAIMTKYQVEKRTETRLVQVTADAFTVECQGEREVLAFDYGFICLGMRANTPLLESLHQNFDEKKVEIMNIGDSLRARRIIDGVLEGRNLLSVLERLGYIKGKPSL